MGGCQKCGCMPCCCTPCKTDVCATKPSCLGVEDLCMGCGETTQYRHGRKTQITQINAKHIQFCGTDSCNNEALGTNVADYIEDLRRMFPYIECDLGRPSMDYGNWADAFIAANIASCAIGLPCVTDQRIPFHEGDVTKHNGCLWMSLVNDNTTEPLANNDKWLCLTSIDGRIKALEGCAICEVVDTNSVDLTKTKLPHGIGNSIKADVIISPDSGNKAVIRNNGLFVATPPDKFVTGYTYNAATGNYEITLNDGTKLTASCCADTNPNDGLPVGAVTFLDEVSGTFVVHADGHPTWSDDSHAVGHTEYYEFNCNEKTFTVADYPYLATTGRKIVMSMIATIGYWVDSDTAKAMLKYVGPYQWGTVVYINGAKVKNPGDAYGCDRSGHNGGLADSASFEFITNGHDLVVRACDVFIAHTTDQGYHQGDSLNVDMGSTTISFAASN